MEEVIILNFSHNNNEDEEILKNLKNWKIDLIKMMRKKCNQKLIDNFKALEVSGPESDPKKIRKDLIPAILEILSWV